jgi:hypothetical protein
MIEAVAQRTVDPNMWKRRRTWLLLAALIGIALAVYFEPSHCVRGWLWGEAFFDGRPTSYWRNEMQQLEVSIMVGNFHADQPFIFCRHPTKFQEWMGLFLKQDKEVWADGGPRLVVGDEDALPVLDALRDDRSPRVSEMARFGLHRYVMKKAGVKGW